MFIFQNLSLSRLFFSYGTLFFSFAPKASNVTSIMFVALIDLQLDLLAKVEDIAWFCYSFLKDPVEIESTSAWCKLHAIQLWICPPVQCSEDLSSN